MCENTDMDRGGYRAAIILLALVVLVGFSFYTPASSSATRCGPRFFPKSQVEYEKDVFTATFTFNLGRCWAEDTDFGFSASIERNVLGTGEGWGKYVLCKANQDRCQVTLEVVHPQIERAQYKAVVRFPSPGGQLRKFRLLRTCTSLVASSYCER